MFFHNYLYRLKCIIRDKQTMFWTFAFPIIMATLFNLALSNINSAESFSKIKVGVVDNAQYRENTAFVKALDSVSNSGKSAGESNLFDVKYTSKADADKLLSDGQIEGYIYLDNGIKLVVNQSGLGQTIIKSFLDDFKQTSSTVETIIRENPDAMQNGLISSVSSRAGYLKEVPVGKSAPDPVVNYFYALIGMACLYGSFMGLKEATALQANLSPQGARVNMAPTHKLKLFLASMSAATTVQLFDIAVLLVYLTLVQKLNFGDQIGYIILTCVIGTITGVSFGTFISSIIKRSEGLKIGILVGLTMVMSFLSGMMYDGIKYTISTNAPVLSYLNPSNLITDSFYSLYYYSTHTQYFTDMALLTVFAAVFCGISYLVLRRQRYASL